jgi:dienelactone hydrolase
VRKRIAPTGTATSEALVHIQSEDGFGLDGVVIRPAGAPARPAAVVWVHGATVSFSIPMVSRLGRALAGHGYVVVAGNNRGHDVGANLWRAGEAPVLGGTRWELFDQAPLDLGAWITYAAPAGAGRVVLAGHSLGAQKVVYYQAERQDPRVVGLVTASPGYRLVRDVLHAPPEQVARAERLVAAGQGPELVPLGGSAPVSAQTFLSLHRVGFDLFGLETPGARIARIRCPLFACYGAAESAEVADLLESAEVADLLDGIRRNATAAPRVETRLFAGADHGYSGREEEVATELARWIATLP